MRSDGTPTVGGIKQSTLMYWTELSFRSHVVVFAVDLKSEKIFLTNSIFWQATTLIDTSDKTKTIEFRPAVELTELSDDIKKREKAENFISSFLVKKIAFGRNISDLIFAHKTLLRNISALFELYTDTWHYDAWTEVQLVDVFKTVLECAEILVGFDLPEKLEGIPDAEIKYLFSFDFWARKTDWSYEEVSNFVAQAPLKAILPLLLDKLQYFSDLILNANYYWFYKDVTYLKLVHQTVIPSCREHDKIIRVNYDSINFKNKESFSAYLDEIRTNQSK